MRICVVIPTYGRKSVLSALLAQLEKQDRPPDEVVISAPDAGHVESLTAQKLPLTYLYGRTGLCAQRNRALDEVLDRCDVVTFFDDDFVPAKDYFAVLEAAFREHPDWAVVTGNVVLDGARNAGVPLEDALNAVAQAPARLYDQIVREREGAYGCNMSFRTAIIAGRRFDEALPLYGWLEDIDFSSQMANRGKVVWISNLVGAHLGTKGGRSSGVRLGYSQVVNPLYLIRKGTLSRRFGLQLLIQNVGSNIARSVSPEPYVDRRGRLRGNLLAVAHLLRLRLDPTHILKL